MNWKRSKEIREALVFGALVIALSYLVFWGPIAFFKVKTANLVTKETGPLWALILFLVGGFLPSLLGITLTAVYEGKAGVIRLFRSAVNIRLRWTWYATMILVSASIAGLQILLFSFGGNFDFSQFIKQLPSIIPLIVLGPISEEFGWRGFLLPRLRKSISLPFASLVTGVIWSFWHLPLFFMLGTSQHEFGLPFFAFLVSVTSTSFIYGYFAARTDANLFGAIFFHWVGTWFMQVVSTTVTRNPLYNWLECIPAFLAGMVFLTLSFRVRRIEPGAPS